MVSVKDIAWAAGFLEGEGWFGYTKTGYAIVEAKQVEQKPLVKLYHLFEGALYHADRHTKKTKSFRYLGLAFYG